MAATPSIRAMAVLQSTPGGFVVELGAGPALRVGQVLDGPRQAAAQRATAVQNAREHHRFTDGNDFVLG